MVVTRVLGAADFLLDRQAPDFNLGNLQPPHRCIRPAPFRTKRVKDSIQL